MSGFRFLFATWGASLRSALEYRTSFLVQAGFMLANNVLFLVFWALFFQKFPQAGGWTLKDVALCYGVAATAFGLVASFLGGVNDLAGLVARGQLDTWLLRPQPVLLQGLTSRMRLSGFGDLATGPVLLVLTGNAQPGRVALFVAGSALGAVAFASFLVACHALSFWLARAEDAAGQAANAILAFGLYPPGIFSGTARVLLFTIVPAGLMSWLPAELVLHPSWSTALRLVAGVAACAGVATFAWTTGLRRYESGNLTQAVAD